MPFADAFSRYLNDFINHFYKNVLKLVDRAMRKEDTSAQGKIVTEILQVNKNSSYYIMCQMVLFSIFMPATTR